jgi:peptidase A4-like protein
MRPPCHGVPLLRRSGRRRRSLAAMTSLALTIALSTWGFGIAASANRPAINASPTGGLVHAPEIPAASPGGNASANGKGNGNGNGHGNGNGNGNGNGHGKGKGGTLNSVNWAGYIDTGPTFSSVAGTWVQPTATCPQNQVQQAAFWVGIGGFVQGDSDIEQIGTDSDCLKGHGHKSAGGPNYYAWYQMFPQGLVVLPTSSYPVSPGQSIVANVTVSGANQYTLAITDFGHWTFSTVQSQASQPADASAEWITEAPSSCTKKCKTLPLADFGSIPYSSASTNGEAISGPGLTDTQVNMTSKNGKTVKAASSALGSGGSSFSVTWESN